MKADFIHSDAELLESLLEVGVSLSATTDRRDMLDVILREARKLTRAEAGSLYILRKNRLRFVAAQNDELHLPEITRSLLDKETAVSNDSLAGFVASNGRVLRIGDAYSLPGDVAFRHNRDFDKATGYRTQSILALPLKRPDQQCVGVLELINCRGLNGQIVPFSDADSSGILSLASIAAVTIHNALLQEDLKQAQRDTIIRLSLAAEFRDDDTADHISRMSRTAELIARGLALGDKTAELIHCASPMHDVGKIGIPDAILRKPGALTPQERTVIEKHPLIGAEILKGSENELIQTAHVVALSHHEKWDGRGYPHGLSGEDIPLCARIVGLADVFDALLTKRCYKEAYPLRVALDVIRRDSGKHFDPAVTKAFFDILDDVVASYQVVSENPVRTPIRK